MQCLDYYRWNIDGSHSYPTTNPILCLPLLIKILFFFSWCITPKNFKEAQLYKEWNILSTSTIRNWTFVSSIEHKNYPFYGVQFHPDRYLSEWHSPNNETPYSWDAIRANRNFFDLLVDLARSNENKFDSQLDETLINNYVPRRWSNSSSLDQAYVFYK